MQHKRDKKGHETTTDNQEPKVEFSQTGRRSMDRCGLLEDEVVEAIECPTDKDPTYDKSGVIIITACLRRDLTIGVHYRYREHGRKEVLRVFLR